MKDGDQLFWHFDQTDFVVSIALRDAEEGGDFEYAPLIRSHDDERYDAVGGCWPATARPCAGSR
jgi:hypothetical protein